MIVEEEVALEEIEEIQTVGMVDEEVEAVHATTATKKDTWQETVPMGIEGTEEGDNFQSNSNKQIRTKLDLVTTYRQRNEIYLLSRRGNTPIGLFCKIEKTMII